MSGPDECVPVLYHKGTQKFRQKAAISAIIAPGLSLRYVMNLNFLDFEQPIAELEAKIKDNLGKIGYKL